MLGIQLCRRQVGSCCRKFLLWWGRQTLNKSWQVGQVQCILWKESKKYHGPMQQGSLSWSGASIILSTPQRWNTKYSKLKGEMQSAGCFGITAGGHWTLMGLKGRSLGGGDIQWHLQRCMTIGRNRYKEQEGPVKEGLNFSDNMIFKTWNLSGS